MNGAFKRTDDVVLLTSLDGTCLMESCSCQQLCKLNTLCHPLQFDGGGKCYLVTSASRHTACLPVTQTVRAGLQLYQLRASSSSGVLVNRSFLHFWKCRITSGPFGKQSRSKEALRVILLSSPNRICLLSLPFSTPSQAPWGYGDIC